MHPLFRRGILREALGDSAAPEKTCKKYNGHDPIILFYKNKIVLNAIFNTVYLFFHCRIVVSGILHNNRSLKTHAPPYLESADILELVHHPPNTLCRPLIRRQ